MQAGDALSSLLPDHVGADTFKSNYSQAFIPGLVTSLRGIRYEPCLLRSSALGAGAAAAGVVFNPELIATRPTGAGVLPHSSLHTVWAALAADRRSPVSRTPCYTDALQEALISIRNDTQNDAGLPRHTIKPHCALLLKHTSVDPMTSIGIESGI